MKINKENFSLTYFLTRPFFFGIIYSQIFSLSGNDSLIACLLGTIIGFIIIYLISKMNQLNKIVQLLFYLFVLVLSFISIETYASSFLLTKTPKLLIIIPAIFLVGYVSFRDTKSLKKTAFIFMIISVTSLLVTSFLLSSYLNTSNITPFFIHKPLDIFKSSLIFAIMSSLPNILLKEEISLKKHLLYYFITSLINTIICFLTLAALTPEVAKIYSYPEFMVLKRIKLLKFIENIENVCILSWYFDYFFLLVFTFKKMINIIKNRIIFWIIISMITLFTTLIISNNFYYTMWLYNYSPTIMFIFLILFLISSAKHK